MRWSVFWSGNGNGIHKDVLAPKATAPSDTLRVVDAAEYAVQPVPMFVYFHSNAALQLAIQERKSSLSAIASTHGLGNSHAIERLLAKPTIKARLFCMQPIINSLCFCC